METIRRSSSACGSDRPSFRCGAGCTARHVTSARAIRFRGISSTGAFAARSGTRRVSPRPGTSARAWSRGWGCGSRRDRPRSRSRRICVTETPSRASACAWGHLLSARAAPPAVVALAALVTLLVAVPAAANDLGLSVGPVELKNGVITVTYRADTPWTPRFTETLLRGMPATVTYEVGLWKKRTFWFDKLVLAIK